MRWSALTFAVALAGIACGPPPSEPYEPVDWLDVSNDEPRGKDAGTEPGGADAGAVKDAGRDSGTPDGSVRPDAGTGSGGSDGGAVLTVKGDAFKLDGTRRFLLGASYFSCLYAPSSVITTDLDYLRSKGVSVIRCWVNWPINHATWDTENPANFVLIRRDGTLDAAAVAKLESMAGAAGWVFHNEECYDLRTGTLKSKLNAGQRDALNRLAAALAATP